MPCQSDYNEPSGAELESKRVGKHLCYVFQKLHKPIPAWIKESSVSYYGNTNRLDEATKILCETIRSLSRAEMEVVVYDAREKKARRLADWWERHQEWDKRRVREEKSKGREKIIRQRALKKLTLAEMKSLGLIKES